ncbi:MAG: hypothetical protein KIT84_17990 [Labilithrix sp.]|nr:hypothetical protein [Labilithrix sp.]MCW5812924.1 hypothetical protein [Labilithrix sp.]
MRRAAIATLAVLAGCNALLGIEPAVHDAPDARSPEPEPEPEETGAPSHPDDPPTPLVDAATPDPGPPEPGLCVDLPNNPRHCGRCDHDCGPGACKAGVCQPGVLAIDVNTPEAFVVTSSHVYYQTGGGDVQRVPIYGGPVATLYSAGAAGLGTNLVVRGEHVYFGDHPGKRVVRCPLAGACTPEVVIPNLPQPNLIASGDSGLYVTNGVRSTHIYRCDGDTCASPTVFTADEDGINQLVVSGQTLVWAVYMADGTAMVRTAQTTDPTPRTLFENMFGGGIGISALTVIGPRAYFVLRSELSSVHLTDGTPPRLHSNLHVMAFQLEPWNGSFWFGNYYTGDVRRWPLGADAGAPPILEVDSDPLLHDMRVESTGIYWTSNKRLMRLAHP